MCVSAQEGGLVDILCRYDIGYETYPKYLYKGDYGKREIIINTTKFKTTTQKGKYNLRDDTKERILHVTIHNLNLNDGGTYWCEIDANTFDPKTEIKLSVYKGMSKLSILFLFFSLFYCPCIHSSSLNTYCLSLESSCTSKTSTGHLKTFYFNHSSDHQQEPATISKNYRLFKQCLIHCVQECPSFRE